MSEINNESKFLLDVNVDFYRLFGLTSEASMAEIKSKYKELTKLYHPDKAKNKAELESHTKLFEKIKLGYEVLRNADLRKEYTDSLQTTYEDLKSEYVNGPKPVEITKCLNNEDFNQQFNQINYQNNRDIKEFSFEDYLKSRQDVQVEPIPKDKLILIKTDAELIVNKLSLNPTEDTKSLLNQFIYIQNNILKNPIISVDYIIACKNLIKEKLDVSFNTELLETLTKKLNYQEPEWGSSGGSALVPFNSDSLIGSTWDKTNNSFTPPFMETSN